MHSEKSKTSKSQQENVQKKGLCELSMQYRIPMNLSMLKKISLQRQQMKGIV